MESNWVDQPTHIKKLFLVMVMRAQRPIGLTAGPFFNMNANTAISVNVKKPNHLQLLISFVLQTVKAAYTYLTFMTRNYH